MQRSVTFELRGLREPAPHQQGVEIGIATHEVPKEFLRRLAVSLAEDAVAESGAGFRIEHAIAKETAEAVGIEDFGPLVAVIPGRIAHGTAENMSEAARDG